MPHPHRRRPQPFTDGTPKFRALSEQLLQFGRSVHVVGPLLSALTHFEEQIRAKPPRNLPGDAAFGMAETAAWCLGDEKAAVKYWRKGTTPGYAVAGTNSRTSLLLCAASALKPDTFSAQTADKLLQQKASHWRVTNWPWPIAHYIIGAASEEEVGPKAVFRNGDPADPNPKSWQFDFYKRLKVARPLPTECMHYRADCHICLMLKTLNTWQG